MRAAWIALWLAMPATALAQLPEPELEEEPPIDLHLRVENGHIEDSLVDEEEEEEEEAAPLPRSAPPEIEDDVAQTVPEAERDPERRPVPFAISFGAGFARLLSAMPYDFLALHQRFEARIPEFPALRVGVGISEMFAQHYFILGGARVGLGAVLFDLGELAAEAIVSVQIGAAGGDLGVYFDLRGTLDVRFLLFDVLEVIPTGSLDFLGSTTMVEVGGLIGIPYG